MDALPVCDPDPPMRIKLPSCDSGGFPASCCTRSWLSFSDHERASMSPCTRTSPGAPALTCASPLPFVNSIRTGPCTVKVLSNVPSALDCGLHPASSKPAQVASKIQPSLLERVMCVFAAWWLATRTCAFTTPGHPSYQSYTRISNQKFPARQFLILWRRTSLRHQSSGNHRWQHCGMGRPLRNLKKGIQRTLAITFQIHSHKRKSGAFDALGNLPRNVRLKSPRQFVRS